MSEGGATRRELIGLAGILAVATVLRFLDLPARGTWDADQGNDMLVLWELVHDGRVPLLGPPTSIGDFHHGVLYYYLLAPIAFLSGADPLAVVVFIAAAGVAAVAAVWWLARSIGGPIAAMVAGGLMAVSSSAIEESTFIWNPNLIALSSAIALAAAWRAWTARRPAWWLVAACGMAVTMHCHVLGSVLIVPLGALLVADARRQTDPVARRRVARAALAGPALIAVSWIPLSLWELQHDFSETRAAVDFLVGGSGGAAPSLLVRLVVVPLRVLSWPLSGLITSQPFAGILAAGAVVAILAWRARAGATDERTAARWFAFTLAWSSIALAFGASSLASVVPGLPNDHYHAFLDPVVFATVGIGAAGLWRLRTPAGRVAAIAGVAALVALNVAIWPPRVAPDGGYPAAELAARAIIQRVGDGSYGLLGLPELKQTDAYGFPLTRLGHPPSTVEASTATVVACDRLLEPIIGASCGGPAEEALVARTGGPQRLVDRFHASSRTVISIYR